MNYKTDFKYKNEYNPEATESFTLGRAISFFPLFGHNSKTMLTVQDWYINLLV